MPKLSANALRILRGHRPGILAYLSWSFGPVRDPAGLVPVDAAYAELAAAGLVVAGEPMLAVLPGEVRAPFKLTDEGDRVRRMGAAAGARERADGVSKPNKGSTK
jgi:hypothetical protein